jgi:hypothetical protein
MKPLANSVLTLEKCAPDRVFADHSGGEAASRVVARFAAVAEGKILEDHVVGATAGHGDRTQEQQGQIKHVPILSRVASESNTGSGMTTFWRTTGLLAAWT